MSGDALALAIKALIPTANADASWTVYDGEVTGTNPPLPWVVMNAAVPGGSHRSEGGASAGDVTVTVIAAAGAARVVRRMLDVILPALDGAIPVVAGMSTGALQPISDPRVDATDVIVGASHVWQGTAAFRCTASLA